MRLACFFAFSSWAACVFLPLSADTWHVDGSVSSSGNGESWATAFKTIQEGIDAAGEGHTVIVAEGTYVENIQFSGRNMTLQSRDPSDWGIAERTIVDGMKRGPVVSFVGSENETCLLSGLTIHNGWAESGGGIAGHGTHATIRNNRITGNSANGQYPTGGGGLALCNGIIQGNRITGNSALFGGGGLYSCGDTITDNTIANNEASWGAGLLWCEGTIENNRVTHNSAGYGGGLHSCDGFIRNNIIAQNSATARGGGLFESAGLVEGNELTWNTAIDGGGLVGCDGQVRGNTIANNSADEEGGGLWRCGGTITNCIIWGNTASVGAQLYSSTAPTYCCTQGGAAGRQGNIDLDPRFADPDGLDDNPDTWEDNDYRLLSDSPCMDVGLNEDWMWQATDLSGNPRIFPGKGSWQVDMGAYEHIPSAYAFMSYIRTTPEGPQVIWTSQIHENYGVWSCFDLGTAIWMEEATVLSQEETTSWVDTAQGDWIKFYRIELKQ